MAISEKASLSVSHLPDAAASVPEEVYTCAQLPETPLIKIRVNRRWAAIELREIWAHRELLYFLVWRDLKVRYKQTILGVSWVVLQPLLMTLVFAVFLGQFARFPSGKGATHVIVSRLINSETAEPRAASPPFAYVKSPREVTSIQPLDCGFREVAIDEVLVRAGRLGPAKSFLIAGLNFHGTWPGRRIGTLILERRAEIPSLWIVHALEARGHAQMKDLSAARRGIALLAK